MLAAAAVATAAGGRARARQLHRTSAWFAVCLIGSWCAYAGNGRSPWRYWAGALVLFASNGSWIHRRPRLGRMDGRHHASRPSACCSGSERDLAAQLREAQAGLADRARAEERNRIARELHDVIAHTLTVSLLHVTSARLAVEHDAADAVRALAEAERLGRESLDEVRQGGGDAA